MSISKDIGSSPLKAKHRLGYVDFKIRDEINNIFEIDIFP